MDMQGNPVVGPRRGATETPLPYRGALGQSGIPESPTPGFGLPPWARGQQEALSRLDTNDTPTPVKVAADAKSMQEQAQSASTGQPHRDNPLTGPAPVDESQDHAATTGLTGRRSLYDVIGLNEEGKSRPEPESYIRSSFDPNSDDKRSAFMQDFAPRGDDNRGHSEMDWSKVANPMAFSDYRERGARKLADMQAEDPFVIEREKSRIKDEEANRDAARRVGVYGGQKNIDIQNEDNRRTRYQAVYEAKAEEMDALMESQKYKKATELEQERAKAIIEDRYAAQIAAMDKANSKKTERIEAD
jgi:hypothetical protein